DHLRALLDRYETIRRAYAAFITPADVLAEVIRGLQTSRPDFDEVMTTYLARELRAAQFANLERAGKHQILLSSVFVDLPFAEERLLDPPSENEKPLRGFLNQLVSLAAERFNDEPPVRTAAGERASDEPGRYVLVGGPGQGKTTLAQFACQLF